MSVITPKIPQFYQGKKKYKVIAFFSVSADRQTDIEGKD